jgi:hypothetical protein
MSPHLRLLRIRFAALAKWLGQLAVNTCNRYLRSTTRRPRLQAMAAARKQGSVFGDQNTISGAAGAGDTLLAGDDATMRRVS